MIKPYHDMALMFAIPGFMVQTYGVITQQQQITLLGAFAYISGLGFFAKSKGWHPAWGLLGVFSLLGLIALQFFKDKTKEEL
jgi:hypothetical protein